MAIVARSRKGLDAAEEQAVRTFFQNPALDPRYQEHNANALEDYMYRWNVRVDAESLAVAYQKLAEAGVLKLRSESQQKFDLAAQGYTQAQQDILDAFLTRVHLVHDPADDRTFENCAAFYGAMRGREFTHDNLTWILQYLQGKGQKLHWLERPSQSREHRGHIPTSPRDYVPSLGDSSGPGPGMVSHSSNPKFNGQAEREAREAAKLTEPDLMASHNWVWMKQAQALQGQTHSETKRIQAVVSQTPGGGRAAYEAGKAELLRIENERARGR